MNVTEFEQLVTQTRIFWEEMGADVDDLTPQQDPGTKSYILGMVYKGERISVIINGVS